MESDGNGSDDIIGNGHMILGLEMASKALGIIHDIELGKPFVLPNCRVGTPQGATMAKRVEETVKSK